MSKFMHKSTKNFAQKNQLRNTKIDQFVPFWGIKYAHMQTEEMVDFLKKKPRSRRENGGLKLGWAEAWRLRHFFAHCVLSVADRG